MSVKFPFGKGNWKSGWIEFSFLNWISSILFLSQLLNLISKWYKKDFSKLFAFLISIQNAPSMFLPFSFSNKYQITEPKTSCSLLEMKLMFRNLPSWLHFRNNSKSRYVIPWANYCTNPVFSQLGIRSAIFRSNRSLTESPIKYSSMKCDATL